MFTLDIDELPDRETRLRQWQEQKERLRDDPEAFLAEMQETAAEIDAYCEANPLNERQLDFVDLLISFPGMSATKAAVFAGFGQAHGTRLLKDKAVDAHLYRYAFNHWLERLAEEVNDELEAEENE